MELHVVSYGIDSVARPLLLFFSPENRLLWFKYREYDLAHLKHVFEFSIYNVWKSVRYSVSKGLDTAYWGFLGVGTTLDIFHNLHILYLQYDVLVFSGYGVLSLFPSCLWMNAGTDERILIDGLAYCLAGYTSPPLKPRSNKFIELVALRNFVKKKLLLHSMSVYYKEMDQDLTHLVAASKVPMLKPGEYELWRTDYSLWEVIENGNAPPITKVVKGVETTIAPTTAEKKAQRRLLRRVICLSDADYASSAYNLAHAMSHSTSRYTNMARVDVNYGSERHLTVCQQLIGAQL
ncbi:hypothetical protein Tco_0909789 [Tanacetum coccineum]|uniref:Uncharacterized protein n=1 Tax=Tanacetum coccineum TaxID=301880 RepID=A0ABQ5CY59_9ASTR